MQQEVAIVESRMYDVACNRVDYVECVRTTNVPKVPNMEITPTSDSVNAVVEDQCTVQGDPEHL